MSTDVKLSQTKLPRIILLGGFLGKALGKMMGILDK